MCGSTLEELSQGTKSKSWNEGQELRDSRVFEGSSARWGEVVTPQHLPWCPCSLHFGEFTINQSLASVAS